ncbi:hypothetical protein [Seleniivibrio sp.]|uniref:hypothetical protein n=1 Tax=Seleniivibrio sp. TaxID=2898801 RepID=UPI0025F5DA6F|nr:hypothetical protein [Seleniivibrio sp.]MCD8553932.1 hypothetical protein [Seleniivibrio sp.]
MPAGFFSFYSNLTLTICVAFASIPFWVPIGAALVTGADIALMLLVTATSIASKIYAKHAVKAHLFSNESPFSSLFMIFVGLCVILVLLVYGASGTEGDLAIAAICTTLLIMFFFKKMKEFVQWTNAMFYLLIFFLWLGFLNSGEPNYAYCAIAVYFILFYRRFGRVQTA